MTNEQIKDVLDQILTAMQQVHHQKPATYHTFHKKLKSLASQLPYGLMLSAVEDKRLKFKISNIWKLFFTPKQGRRGDTVMNLGTIDRDAREILIDHMFYLDCEFEHNRTILFKLLETLNITLVKTICTALHELNILEQFVYKKDTSNKNIFQHVECILTCQTAPDSRTCKVRLLQTQRFAEELKLACEQFHVAHGFSTSIDTLIQIGRRPNRENRASIHSSPNIKISTIEVTPSFDSGAASVAARTSEKFSTLRFLSEHNKWDFTCEPLSADKHYSQHKRLKPPIS